MCSILDYDYDEWFRLSKLSVRLLRRRDNSSSGIQDGGLSWPHSYRRYGWVLSTVDACYTTVSKPLWCYPHPFLLVTFLPIVVYPNTTIIVGVSFHFYKWVYLMARNFDSVHPVLYQTSFEHHLDSAPLHVDSAPLHVDSAHFHFDATQ